MTTTRRRRVKGKIVLMLDHEPGERDQASPFDGVVTAEPAVPFRKVLAAQEKGAIGVLFVSDVHNHPADARRPELPGRGRALLARDAAAHRPLLPRRLSG